MKIHYFGLQHQYFQAVQSGTKDIELRLLDSKRRTISLGDRIQFTDAKTKETITKEVRGLLIYPTFKDLLETIPIERVSWPSMTTDEMLKIMQQFYPLEKQHQLGVVGIVLKNHS